MKKTSIFSDDENEKDQNLNWNNTLVRNNLKSQKNNYDESKQLIQLNDDNKKTIKNQKKQIEI